jgi:hypothetical protein
MTSFFVRYFEEFGETVSASREGNAAAITEGLKLFARRVSSIFRPEDERLGLGLESGAVDLLNGDACTEDNSASGSEVSQEDDIQECVVPDGTIKDEQVEEAKDQISSGIDDNENAPATSLNLPQESTSTNEDSLTSSLLSALQQEFPQVAEIPHSQTQKSTNPTSSFAQQQQEDEFEVVTLQKMKLLRQRILDSSKPAPLPESVPSTPSDNLGSETTEKEIETPDLIPQQVNEHESLPVSSAPAETTTTATPIVSSVGDEDEPIEKTNDVDSDDELE